MRYRDTTEKLNVIIYDYPFSLYRSKNYGNVTNFKK